MANIEAFRGIRYDLGHVGALSDVVAPPYDVIDETLQDTLYEQHPANVIRLILNRDEPGDDDPDQRYQRAAKYLKQWQQEGVLCSEADPAIYVYHQVFEEAGVTYTRRGFMSRVRPNPRRDHLAQRHMVSTFSKISATREISKSTIVGL